MCVWIVPYNVVGSYSGSIPRIDSPQYWPGWNCNCVPNDIQYTMHLHYALLYVLYRLVYTFQMGSIFSNKTLTFLFTSQKYKAFHSRWQMMSKAHSATQLTLAEYPESKYQSNIKKLIYWSPAPLPLCKQSCDCWVREMFNIQHYVFSVE